MIQKKNMSLIAALSIPLFMILLIIASIYWPKTTVQPKFNFLYLIGENYNNNQEYLIQNGKVVKTRKAQENQSRFFLYDVAQHKSQEISFQEAQKLNLDPKLRSPDGFEVASDSNDDGIFSLFFGTPQSYKSRYLNNHNSHIKLNITPSSNNSYYDFRFLGWVKHD